VKDYRRTSNQANPLFPYAGCRRCEQIRKLYAYHQDPTTVSDRGWEKRQADKIARKALAQERMKMSLLLHAPVIPDCNHAIVYESTGNLVFCVGCGQSWPAPTAEERLAAPIAVAPMAPAPIAPEAGAEAAPKRRGRPPKNPPVGTASPAIPTPSAPGALPGAELPGTSVGTQLPLPPAPNSVECVQKTKTSRRGKKAEKATEVLERGPEHDAVGPWHEILKCPTLGCANKLKHNGNIVAGGHITYHYRCDNCRGGAIILPPESVE